MSHTSTGALVVGHYCHDTILTPAGRFEVLGGSSSYISAVFSALGVPFEVVAKVGEDFRYAQQVVRPARIAPGAQTTHFIDDLRSGARRARLEVECDPIRPEDLGTQAAEVGLACGVAHELLPETLLRLRSLCPVLIADLQGLIRARGPQGEVLHVPLAQTPFAALAGELDYLKVGEDELPFVDVPRLSHQTAVLVTLGKGGVTLVREGRETHVPAVPVEEVDSTGAGDCFTAGFATALIRGADPVEALRWGNHFGALAVQQVGIPDFSKVQLPKV